MEAPSNDSINKNKTKKDYKEELLETIKQEKRFYLSNWEEINIDIMQKWYNDMSEDLIKKYQFNWVEWNIFKDNTWIYAYDTLLQATWNAANSLKKCDDWQQKPVCNISINPEKIDNKLLYKAVFFHELDHHAFFVKKYLNSQLYWNNFTSKSKEENTVKKFIKGVLLPGQRFATELLARADTVNYLMMRWAPWDKIWRYGLWEECDTTWEAFYTDSIIYAKKFIKFQIWLYVLLGKHFWLDNLKKKNQQLPDEANKHFQTIMDWLRMEIFNSPSIGKSKKIIDKSYKKLQQSKWSRNKFCSLREK